MPHSHATYKKLRKMVQKVTSAPLFEISKNAKYNFSQLMKLPIAAALTNRSIENQSLSKGRISGDDFYYHFNGKLGVSKLQNMFSRHIKQTKRILRSLSLFQKKIIVAIDKTEDLFWGKTEGNEFVTGGKRESSTNYAFRYLTATSIIQGQRFFLYVRPLTKEDTNDALLVEECLDGIRKLGFQVGTLLMDREFYNGKIVLICNIQKIAYVVPAVKNEKLKRHIKELKKEGKKFPRIIEGYEIADEITNLILYEEKNKDGKSEVFGFITNLDVKEIAKNVDTIIELYRLRWGVENAHKFHDRFWISTNSTNGVIRFFFFLLGVIFHNLWVLLRLLAAVFGAAVLSIDVMKDILREAYELNSPLSYKHKQRELWLDILIGKDMRRNR